MKMSGQAITVESGSHVAVRWSGSYNTRTFVYQPDLRQDRRGRHQQEPLREAAPGLLAPITHRHLAIIIVYDHYIWHYEGSARRTAGRHQAVAKT
jgi:hypothetical protein